MCSAIDPITLEVIRHGLVSITNQIDANIKRTAFSPYIYEYNDFAVGLVGTEGQLIAQCTGGMPPFVADSVGMAVREGLSIYGKARLLRSDGTYTPLPRTTTGFSAQEWLIALAEGRPSLHPIPGPRARNRRRATVKERR